MAMAMVRWTIPLLVAITASGSAAAADRAVAHRGWHRAAVILPAGLPRAHYNFRTTISYDAPNAYRRPYARRFYAYETPQVLFTPVYYYQEPYYAGPYVNYWDRLPYACGVYGYC
jgi:hypothetical protein